MIAKKREATATTGDPNGFFPGGAQTYSKTWFLPQEMAGQTIVFEFEGAYMHAAVYINGDFAGHCPHGYTTFHIDAGRFLKPGQDNEIKVVTKTSNDRDSRWYSGSGLYRDVWIITGGPLHIAVDGVQITTPDVERDQAAVSIATTVDNRETRTRKVFVLSEIRNGVGQVVNSEKTPLTAYPGEKITVRQRLFVQSPDLWSPDSPALYSCHTTLLEDDILIDQQTVNFGIRKLQLDPRHGLRINGETIKMRGGCIHHDNGVLGACAFPRAEERKVRILKEAGYNAIRSAHNPISKAMLDACDRIGMLVMDELNDAWNENKSDYDSALFFADWWEFMVKAMVNKDMNHPSVVLYSIGNEIQEVVRPGGAALNRRIAEKVRQLDSSRFVTNGINVFLSMNDKNDVITATLAAIDPEVAALVAKVKEARETMANIDINTMMSLFGIIMERGASLDIVDDAIEIGRASCRERVYI